MNGAPTLHLGPVGRQAGDRDGLGRAATEAVDADDAPTDPLIGTEVGRYRLTRVLGEGGMGRVYLAVQPAIGSRVAIKILLDASMRNAELVERFFAEARAVNLVNHEHIVSIVDLAHLSDGRPFIVMEYVEGITLSDVARQGPVPLGSLAQVMGEVLSALGAAHAIGIVHRDLKPDNIRVTAEGHAKVLDFGVAKLAPALQEQLSPRTRTGALLGTPHYMAPEQISGSGAIDRRIDLYAAGVVLYELATGRKPFTGETLFDLMRAHLEEAPQPPRALRGDLPEALERVILTALAKQPDDRYASAAEMALALREAVAALPADQFLPLAARKPAAPAPAFRSAAGSQASGAASATVASGARRAVLDDATRPAMIEPARRIARRTVVLAGAAVVVAVAAVVAWLVASPAPSRGASAPTVTPPPTAAPATISAPPTPPAATQAPTTADRDDQAPPAAAPTIALQLEIEPRGATVQLDGTPVPGGAIVVAKDDAWHALRITAPGHLALDELVRFDQSQRLVLQLKRAPAPRPDPPVHHMRIDSQSPY